MKHSFRNTRFLLKGILLGVLGSYYKVLLKERYGPFIRYSFSNFRVLLRNASLVILGFYYKVLLEECKSNC
jgi:hypothetical protein